MDGYGSSVTTRLKDSHGCTRSTEQVVQGRTVQGARWFCLCNRSRHGAPTDRASLRLLHGARRRRSLKVRARLCRWHSSGECLPPRTTHHAPAGGFAFATEAAMELRLIEHACGCSTVRDGGGASRCVLVSAAGTLVESACRHAPRTKHLQVVLPLRRKPPWSSD